MPLLNVFNFISEQVGIWLTLAVRNGFHKCSGWFSQHIASHQFLWVHGVLSFIKIGQHTSLAVLDLCTIINFPQSGLLSIGFLCWSVNLCLVEQKSLPPFFLLSCFPIKPPAFKTSVNYQPEAVGLTPGLQAKPPSCSGRSWRFCQVLVTRFEGMNGGPCIRNPHQK